MNDLDDEIDEHDFEPEQDIQNVLRLENPGDIDEEDESNDEDDWEDTIEEVEEQLNNSETEENVQSLFYTTSLLYCTSVCPFIDG